jgi:hypothetical protein
MLGTPLRSMTFVIVPGLNRASPKKYQGYVGGVDGAVPPKGRDVHDLARCEFRRPRRAVLTFKQYQPVTRNGLVGFGVIALAVVMARVRWYSEPTLPG